MRNIILWPIAFCGPFSISEDFVLTITTFSSQGSFMKLFIFLDDKAYLKVFLPKA